ncbi:NADH-quinone oxidoreductase subunit L [Methylocaldum sp.]|uniref:NADH-quinone oxidoreductase subunit L n=1 Tax=Methylocaldum sp. TaxID=1969727 RepID=UPI002D280093|nr:NADH-quinone oxidoreductase subunit L [Methylocaldum sp.]HYE36076.1 NADH-quinone oxidoreductase subunit L [Methylocaldum sp.]
MLNYLGLIPLFPLVGFLILVASQGNMPKRWVPWIGAGSVGLSAVFAALIGIEFLNGPVEPYRQALWTWMRVGGFTPSFSLYLDALSLNMMFVVTGVGFLIHVYSAGFMADDLGLARFFAYMNLFVFAMLILVLADNLVLLYLGWEGVGLCSYLLIGFWYENPENGTAARKAFVMTRVGDTAMAVGLFLLFTRLGTLDIQTLMQRAVAAWPVGSGLAALAAVLLLGGAIGKSAQLPLQTWLPDAMAGPTPISALIHAATMVTAGVYLIARTHTLFELAPAVLQLVAVIGAVTLLIAGFTALTQRDIKRILAYSTISQIGYMFLALGVTAFSSAIFHLTTHAYFKALLFLAAGAVIHSYHHEHDIFRMGGLRKRLPVAFWSFIIGSAALTALPFTSGYFSKHEILASAFRAENGLWFWAAGTLGALLTGIYSFRLVFIAFFGPENRRASEHLGFAMSTPLIVLGALALFGGLVSMPLGSVFPRSASGELGLIAGLATDLAPFIGIGVAILLYLTRTYPAEALTEARWGDALHRFWFSGWGFDWLYGKLLVNPFRWLAAVNRDDIADDIYRGIAAASRYAHRAFAATQTGQLRWYVAGLTGGTVLAIALGILS